jgi:hypothetical protein
LPNLIAAFEAILAIQSREVTLHDMDTPLQATVQAANANYFRNLQGPEEMTTEGREYVISKSSLDSAGFSTPVKGWKLIDPLIGTNTIKEVREMIIFGEIAGYRVRAD